MTIEIEEEEADGWVFVRFFLPRASELTSRGVLMLTATEWATMKRGLQWTSEISKYEMKGEEDGTD